MAKPPVFVTKPTLASLQEFVPLLEKIWENGILTNNGPFSKKLEHALCEYLGIEHISLYSNGTIALLSALQQLGLDGEVITTPFSFVATSHAISWLGLKPVFVDICPNSLNLDPSKIEAAITSETSAILPVHCYGNPCDSIEIQRIADKHNLKVVYDAAHAFGVTDHNGSILKYGNAAVLSFHATKVFNTFEGGAVVCDTKEQKEHLDRLKNFGIRDHENIDEVGLNGKMSEIHAAFGLTQLAHVDEAISKRKKVFDTYQKILSKQKGIKYIGPTNQTQSNHSYYAILITDDFRLSRNELFEALMDEGIFSRKYFYPILSNLPMYSGLQSASNINLPVANKAGSQVLCLPIYPNLSTEDATRAAELIVSLDT